MPVLILIRVHIHSSTDEVSRARKHLKRQWQSLNRVLRAAIFALPETPISSFLAGLIYFCHALPSQVRHLGMGLCRNGLPGYHPQVEPGPPQPILGIGFLFLDLQCLGDCARTRSRLLGRQLRLSSGATILAHKRSCVAGIGARGCMELQPAGIRHAGDPLCTIRSPLRQGRCNCEPGRPPTIYRRATQVRTPGYLRRLRQIDPLRSLIGNSSKFDMTG